MASKNITSRARLATGSYDNGDGRWVENKAASVEPFFTIS
jgi:hypothetical protein